MLYRSRQRQRIMSIPKFMWISIQVRRVLKTHSFHDLTNLISQKTTKDKGINAYNIGYCNHKGWRRLHLSDNPSCRPHLSWRLKLLELHHFSRFFFLDQAYFIRNLSTFIWTTPYLTHISWPSYFKDDSRDDTWGIHFGSCLGWWHKQYWGHICLWWLWRRKSYQAN